MFMKIVVGGHIGAGKTTFIKTLVGKDFAGTERRATDKVKEKTTVGMDVGNLLMSNINLSLIGLAGQSRFKELWRICAKGAKGYIFLFDSTQPKLWEGTKKQIEILLKGNPRPFILALNKRDLPDAISIEEGERIIREELKIEGYLSIVPTVALRKDSVIKALNLLILRLMGR